MYCYESGSTDPDYNLALEEYLLTSGRSGDILMLWQNYNTVVIGLNQNAEEEIDRSYVEEHGINVVRRKTGGGAVYHDLGNLNYSFISDLGDAAQLSIRRFTEPVCRALKSFGVDAETSGRNDIVIDGRKVSGVAQRISGDRILHHGTLLFCSDLGEVSRVLKADPEKFKSKSTKSVRSRVANISEFLSESIRIEDFKQRLFAELSGDELIRQDITEEERCEVNALADSCYRSWEWNYGISPAYSFSNRVRYPGGTLEVRADIRGGRIQSIVFYGDFMALMPNTAASDRLKGVPFRRENVREALSGLELDRLFGSICEDEILDTMFA